MKTKIEQPVQDLKRDLYWVPIVFVSDDEIRRTKVLVCSTREHLRGLYDVPGDKDISEANIDHWIKSAVEKWSRLGGDIFNQDIHYDVSATTPEGESAGLDFLLKMTV